MRKFREKGRAGVTTRLHMLALDTVENSMLNCAKHDKAIGRVLGAQLILQQG